MKQHYRRLTAVLLLAGLLLGMSACGGDTGQYRCRRRACTWCSGGKFRHRGGE